MKKDNIESERKGMGWSVGLRTEHLREVLGKGTGRSGDGVPEGGTGSCQRVGLVWNVSTETLDKTDDFV